MLILSKIVRDPGTSITMADGTRYAFMPNDEGDHVAEVTDNAHIERLLAITEGFEIYSGEVIPANVVSEALTQGGEGVSEPVPPVTEPSSDTPSAHPYPDPAQTESMPLEHMTLADLQALYERELERKPHHRAGPEKLIEDITAHRATTAPE